jgi:hypothetical protein
LLKYRLNRLLTAAAVSLFVSFGVHSPAQAQASGEATVAIGPRQPDDCVTQAATYHSVSPWILRAIIQVESSFNPNALNKNNNGTVDIGIAQINSMHFKELGKYGIGWHLVKHRGCQVLDESLQRHEDPWLQRCPYCGHRRPQGHGRSPGGGCILRQRCKPASCT